ncbi:phosphatase 2C [Thraustotheca clavata]|uniref:Phosphatase 2C n=1 Tax=Thraustotheca clavata TaxID=74557 RepID=A0A1V9ZAA1_9STRA|nr:phosphatase 2C [Thraustotheca clavata]
MATISSLSIVSLNESTPTKVPPALSICSSPRNDPLDTLSRPPGRLLSFSRKLLQAKQPHDSPVASLLRSRGVQLSPRPSTDVNRWKKRVRSNSDSTKTTIKKTKCSISLSYPQRRKPSKGKLSTAIDTAIKRFHTDKAKNTTFAATRFGHVMVTSTQGTRHYMEDHFVMQLQLFEDSRASLFGIFDGHNGNFAAEYASLRLVELVSANEQLHSLAVRLAPLDATQSDDVLTEFDREQVNEGLQQVFEQLDEEIISQTIANKSRDGSTALIALILGNGIFVANVGDTRAVRGVHTGNELTSQRVSLDHKPTLDDEKNRIEQSGGKVVYSGCWRVAHDEIGLRLAVSRSLGDHPLKVNLPASCSAPLVSCQPSIEYFSIAEAGEFLVLASDGLWDRVSDEEAVEAVHSSLNLHDQQHNAVREGLKAAVHSLVESALTKKSYDNITVMLLHLSSNSN